MRMKALGAGLLAAIALSATACGGGGSGGSAAAGASLVRPNVLAFASMNTDFTSAQWHKAAALISRFPSGGQLLSTLQSGLSSQNVDYKRDIAPALGPELDFVVNGVSTLGTSPSSASFAVMTKPKDEGKLKKLLAKAGSSGSSLVHRKVNGWYVFSNSNESLNEAVKTKGNSLSQSAAFKDAMSSLPKGTLLRAYVSGKSITSYAKAAASSAGTLGAGSSALGNLDFLGIALSAESGGFRIVATAKGGSTSRLSSSSTYTPALLSDIPAGALAVVSLHGSKNTTAQLQKTLQNGSIGPQLQQFQTALGVTPQQILGLLEHEIAFYVRPGDAATTGLPEFDLMLQEPNQGQALSTVDTAMTRLAGLLHTTVTSSSGGKSLKIQKLNVSYGGTGKGLLVTTGPGGVSGAKASGSSLTSDPVFTSAKSDAKLPSKTGGFFYVNLQDSIPLIENYEQSKGRAISPTVRDNLAPLRSVLAFGSSAGSVGKFTIFLQIK